MNVSLRAGLILAMAWLFVFSANSGEPGAKSDATAGKKEKNMSAEPVYKLWNGGEFPKSADIPLLKNVQFSVIKAWNPEADGYRFLHGVALAWHQDRLYASFGHNRGGENSGSEQARYCISEDAGRTWGQPLELVNNQADWAASHGAFLAQGGRLWAFMGVFRGDTRDLHTQAFVLDVSGHTWEPRGKVVSDGFWPTQEPQKMADGNWIMAGFQVGQGYPAAVAVSRGDDLTAWTLVTIPPAAGKMWGESAVILDGPRILSLARHNERPCVLVAVSKDYGRTWTASQPSNLPMACSKPYAGTLSTGQHYLIGSMTADGGNRRSPLTIAVTRPGELEFCRVWRIRDAVHAGGGESNPRAALAYPYAVEHQGRLYVGYSNSGGRGGKERQLWNNNSAELAIIPLTELAVSAK